MSVCKCQLHWVSAAASDRGRVRRVNEDAYLDRADIGLWAVADGMGGHDAGDLASRMVVEALHGIPPSVFLGRAVVDLRGRLFEANRRLREEAVLRRKDVIGSTVAVVLALGGHCALLWVGDSRIYRLRNGLLRRLSRDHSRVEELVDQGVIARAAAESHPAANIVTRAIGAEDTLQVDAQICDIRSADRLLLCTDGLTKEIAEAEILRILAAGAVNEAAHALVGLACSRGARDNVTVLVVEFLAREPAAPSRR